MWESLFPFLMPSQAAASELGPHTIDMGGAPPPVVQPAPGPSGSPAVPPTFSGGAVPNYAVPWMQPMQPPQPPPQPPAQPGAPSAQPEGAPMDLSPPNPLEAAVQGVAQGAPQQDAAQKLIAMLRGVQMPGKPAFQAPNPQALPALRQILQGELFRALNMGAAGGGAQMTPNMSLGQLLRGR